mmetsp:Transcript_96117/g.269039  ORF Transcript_96117/g.269039 Transcript_96117/m.269039 type:complete len:211 (+) Transcript_96117:1005-1637(+)
MLPCVLSRTSMHQSCCFWSLSPSSASKAMTLSISVRMISKGLVLNMSAMRPRVEEPCVLAAFWRNSFAAFRGAASKPGASSATAKFARCRRTARCSARCVCKSAAAPCVASEVPKVSKAASLLRMEIAWASAACSLVRSFTRSSYCFAFVAQASPNFARKSSASAFIAVEMSSCCRLEARPPSFAASSPCFLTYAASISSKAFNNSPINL